MPDELKWIGLGPIQIDELPKAAAELVRQSKGHTVWLLKGEMGSGKTTLTKQIVEQLGVDGTVASPTFSIVNQYGTIGGKVVYHFDLYRLKNELEAFDIGLEEYLNSGNVCLIEWPEKLEKLLPSQYFEVHIESVDSLRRNIYYRRHD
jgi:tRNA threonylcarbamoyladenosine biosynthesis protein TsaE